jgi:hypothetical protein
MSENIEEQWLNSLVQLIKIGQANDFLDENGAFKVCLSSDTEKISIDLKIEPTNIIQLNRLPTQAKK